nr:rhomboid family intramembrane serine protease [uncultured Pseudomonas sp.]
MESLKRWRLPWLTLSLILVTIAAYLWQARQLGGYGPFGEDQLMSLGSNIAILTLTGEYGRLLSNLFLHASLAHLGQNMLALLLIGVTLESLLARWQWLLLYLLGGVFASLASAAVHVDQQQVSFFGQVTQVIFVSVGASGAIMSLAGAELAIALSVKLRGTGEAGDSLLRNALLVPLLALVYGLIDQGTDNAAHLGGFLFGLLATLPLCLGTSLPARLGIAVGALLALALGTFNLLNPVFDNPRVDELRQMALHEVQETRRIDTLKAHIEAERQAPRTWVDGEQAQGFAIDLPVVARIVPSSDPSRVYLLKNDADMQIIEYDLTTQQPLRTLLTQPYARGQLWGCPGPECVGVGVTDMALDEPAGKAYVLGLSKGAVSRIDLASGAIEYSVPVSDEPARFPSRVLLHEGRLYVMDRADNSLTILEAASGKRLERLQLPAAGYENTYIPTGETLLLSSQGDALYLLPSSSQPMRLDLDSQQLSEIGEDGAQQMGRDAQGRIWLLYEDGVLYPQEQGQRERVPFHLPAAGMPGWMALIDPDGHSPLILHLSEGFILASSAQTGQVLRAYPLNVPPSDIFALQYLAGGRFYLSTRQGLQIFDVDQALDGREVAAEYQQLLEESTAWQLRLERQPLEQPANDW